MTDEMYNQVIWMKPADWAILELVNRDLELTPANIAKNTGYSSKWASKRCDELTERGLMKVETNGDPYYSITEFGREAVNRDLRPEDVEDRGLLSHERENNQ